MATKEKSGKKAQERVNEVIEKSRRVLIQGKAQKFVFYGIDEKGKGGFINYEGELTNRITEAKAYTTADAAWLDDFNPNWELTLLQLV